MSIDLTVRPATEAESMYTYTQSSQIQGQTGCIGHLRADMDGTGEGFFSSWDDHRGYLKTDAFKAEFDEVINRLRFGSADENGSRTEDDGCFLKNRTALARYCRSRPSARMKTQEENYAFRADTDSFTYMMRVTPEKGLYNLYCYCYRSDWLDQHLRNAERGIRFINSRYKDLFRVPDGGKVRLFFCDGGVRDVTCRYIDEYHLELGGGSCNLFHICELAEMMERNGNRIEPVDVLQYPEKKPRHKDRGGEAR